MDSDREVRAGELRLDLLPGYAEFWWMNEEHRAMALEARARDYGGQGYGIDLAKGYGRER